METITMPQGQVVKNGKMIFSSIVINARPQQVWAVLADFTKYGEWNPFVRSFKGVPVVGGKVSITLHQPGGKPMTFTPTILQFNKDTELKWLGTLLMPYIFDGEHTFKLQDNGDDTTTLLQYEHFRGILVPMLKNMLDKQSLEGFKQMNEALKKRVESLA